MFGIELQARRRALGLSREDMATLLDMSSAALARWELGARPIKPNVADEVAAIEATVDDAVGLMFEAAADMALAAGRHVDEYDAGGWNGVEVTFAPTWPGLGAMTEALAVAACGRLRLELMRYGARVSIVPALAGEGWARVTLL